jgi:hypothetical protein
MFAEFDSLQDSSRVWVYQSVRKLTQDEERTISGALQAFTQQWAAHGQPLKSSFKISYHQFIILAADESYNQASGCSIDDSVHIIKEIDQHYKLNLFDRTKVGFLMDETVYVIPMNELSKALSESAWNQDSLVFNNVVNIKADLSENWIVPAHKTWLKRYLTGLRYSKTTLFCSFRIE